METTNETVETYTEPDGTKVVKRTIITRTSPSGHRSSSSSEISSGRLAPASSPSSTLNYADPKTLNEFEKVCLNKHNEYRKLHGVPPLQMSKEVYLFNYLNSSPFILFLLNNSFVPTPKNGQPTLQAKVNCPIVPTTSMARTSFT